MAGHVSVEEKVVKTTKLLTHFFDCIVKEPIKAVSDKTFQLSVCLSVSSQICQRKWIENTEVDPEIKTVRVCTRTRHVNGSNNFTQCTK